MIIRTAHRCSHVLFVQVSSAQCAVRGMAGHSKWQNIRHIKGAKDAEKSQDYNLIIRRLRQAVLFGGGSTKPEFNQRLANVIEEARRHNMPKDTIQRTLEKIASSDPSSKKMFEAKGPGGCMLLIDALVDNEKQRKAELNGIFKRYSAKMLDQGQALHAFDYKAILDVPVTQPTSDLDSMVDMAIECGAEDITCTQNEDDLSTYQFICSGEDKHLVKKALESRGFSVSSVTDEYLPHLVVKLTNEDETKVASLIERLTDTEFIMNIYDNIAEPET